MRRLLTLLLIVALLVAFPLSCSKEKSDTPEGHTHASAVGAEARDKPFVASVLRDPFHRSDCKWAKKIHVDNLVGYDNREDAIEDGHRPCKVCRP